MSYTKMQAIAASGTTSVDALAEDSWNETAGTSVSLTYSFSTPLSGVSDFTLERQQSAIQALEAWAAVSNITFTQVSGDADITFGTGDLEADMGPDVAGVAYQSFLGNVLSHVDIVIDDDVQGDYSPGLTPFQYLLHEIGHALGLKHPFEGSPQLSSSLDNSDNTVMSYTEGTVSMRLNLSPMIGDITAIQYLYGIRAHNTGDTVYHYTSATSGSLTLWDTGGTDMIDSSGNGWGSTIDLRDGLGHHSNILLNNIWIASGVQIENAMGDIYTDIIDGNSTGNRLFGNLGNDTIDGHEGNDTICGGASFADPYDGNDTAIGGAGDDIIYGNAGDDKIIGGAQEVDPNENGNDILYGGLGNDTLCGNGGNDTLVGSAGNDMLYGGAGDDHYVMLSGGGIDWVFFAGAGQQGGDVLKVATNINGSGIVTAADVLAHSFSDGTHTYIDFGAGEGALLLYTYGQLAEGDILMI